MYMTSCLERLLSAGDVSYQVSHVTLYVKSCLERLLSAGDVSYQASAKCMDVFNNAFRHGRLSEAVVCDWLAVLKSRGAEAEMERVSGLAMVKFPHSVAVWTQRLDLLILTNTNTSTLMECLDTALQTIRENDWLPLWNIIFPWCLLNSTDNAATETLLQRGVQAGVKVSVVAKECYLEWAVQQHDITFVRQLYRQLSSSKPLSVDFFRKYLEIEQAQATSKIKRLRRAYEDALGEYGSSDTDLWLDYIRLETRHKNGSPENAGNIHWRALKALDEELVQTFVSEYTLMQTGHL
ncbi:hypothetical protein LSAT2_009429 [Lamellibrachia satsuma]|nr:hypothetical protein LSAT2_009429 [Lamellibrachia satsuma]